LTFNGGAGVIPLVSVTGCPTACVENLNVVRGVVPGGVPWVINELKAQVSANGSIKVSGQGLVLAGGANPGQGTHTRADRDRQPDLSNRSRTTPYVQLQHHRRRYAVAQR
jgi:hypothetical protein